jgi:nickel-dependent lactate racemase
VTTRSDRTLAWGATRLALPESWRDWRWLEPEPSRASSDRPDPLPAALSDAAARTALRLGRSDRLALIVPDRTRPLPLSALLPPLLDALADAGVAGGRIDLVPASGIHRPMSAAELREWIGPDAAARVTALPHDADAPAAALGVTPCGIAVAAHPAVARAGAILALGRIVFHYLAGFGGGRKMLVPGVAARDTIVAVHRRCLSPRPGDGRHPRARAGVLEGNPVHAAASDAARLFPPATLLHLTQRPDGGWRAEVGDAFEDHARAAALYAAAHSVALDAPLDAVVVSAGGAPADRDLVQAHKALDAVAPVVRDGGTVVLVAACGDGVGNHELLEGLALGPPSAIEDELRRAFRVGLHTALALAEKTRRFRVLALTELSDEILATAGMARIGSLEEAARELAPSGEYAARQALAPRGASLLYEVVPRQAADRRPAAPDRPRGTQSR